MLMWDVSKEQEAEFRKQLDINTLNEIDIDELFKLIRGAEYRRAKEDNTNDILKIINEYDEDSEGVLRQIKDRIEGK